MSMTMSGINFRAENPKAMDSGREVLNNPQARSKAQSSPIENTQDEVELSTKKKSHKVRNTIIGTLVAAAAIVGGLVAGHKMGGFKNLIANAAKEDAGKVAKFLGSTAEYGESAGKAICEFAKPVTDYVSGFFKKEGGHGGAPEIIEG